MKIVEPAVYKDFRCIGGACPDTCCAAWEVVVDDASAARYAAAKGNIGDRLRAAMTEDEGDTVFRVVNGRCPFLNKENLCDIYIELGEDALCRTCTLFPRFFHSFGGVTERGLSLSCPEAARLLLQPAGPLELITREEPGFPEPNELNPTLYLALRKSRDAMLAMLQSGEIAPETALRRLWAAGNAMQRKVNGKRYAAVAEACTAALEGEGVPFQTVDDCLPVWKELEFLGEELPERLETLPAEFPQLSMPAQNMLRQVLTYLVYRYVLQAAYDRQILPKMRLVVRLWLLCAALCGGEEDVSVLRQRISLACKEVEHNEENLRRMMSE